jgi:hypothetical protein
MSLFIEIEEGKPKHHPAFENNILEAFGHIPPNFEPFVRVSQPMLDVYQVLNDPPFTYEKINGIWTDVWSIRPMSESEKIQKQNDQKSKWNEYINSTGYPENWSAWIFNEDTCQYSSPVPPPENTLDKFYEWCGADSQWKEVPERPVDGNQYKFNYSTWSWVSL